MTDYSRRKFFGTAAAAGGTAAAGLAANMGTGEAARAAVAAKKQPGAGLLNNVWGEDFLYQWSPPENVKRDLTPGKALIRLCGQGTPRMNSDVKDWDAFFKAQRDGGWTAVEVGSGGWLNKKFTDAEVREVKEASKKYDVTFYNIHCAGNIIAPDPDADRWQRHIIDAIHSAEQFGCPTILTHAGSMYPNRNTAHPMNWSKEAWQRTVKALKRICKDTAGSKVAISIEPVNTESINNPYAQVRLREDVGDSRIHSGLDITNMVAPNVAFRMSEMINLTFDLLEDQCFYIHAKDFVWNDMMAGLNWAMNGTGNMDYELFMARISRLKTKEVYMMIEFLNTNDEYAQAQRNVRNISKKLGINIHGTQPA